MIGMTVISTGTLTGWPIRLTRTTLNEWEARADGWFCPTRRAAKDWHGTCFTKYPSDIIANHAGLGSVRTAQHAQRAKTPCDTHNRNVVSNVSFMESKQRNGAKGTPSVTLSQTTGMCRP